MKTILIFLILFITQSNLFSQTENSAFIDIMKTEFEAFQKKDPTVWTKYADKDAVFTGLDNNFKTKNQIMEEMKNASDIFNSGKETYDNVITKVFGDTAILSCLTTFTFTSSDGNRKSLKFKFTRVHIKVGTVWKLVYHSAIPI